MSFLIFLFLTDIDAEFHGEFDGQIKTLHLQPKKSIQLEKYPKNRFFEVLDIKTAF